MIHRRAGIIVVVGLLFAAAGGVFSAAGPAGSSESRVSAAEASAAAESSTSADPSQQTPQTTAASPTPPASPASPQTTAQAAGSADADAAGSGQNQQGDAESTPSRRSSPHHHQRLGHGRGRVRHDESHAGTSEGTTDSGASKKVSLAFKNMSMEKIAKFISEKTGKPVIPSQSIKDKKVTIISASKMTLPEAMRALRQALRLSEVVMDEEGGVINLRPLADAAQANLPILADDQPLSEVQDPSRIVRKVFRVEHYDPLKIKDAIAPMLPPYGGVVADAKTGKIVVTASVQGLSRIEQVIQTLDVPSAGQASRNIIKLQHADASWVVSVIRLMISGDESTDELGIVSGGGGNGSGTNARRRRRHNNRNKHNGGNSNHNGGQPVVAIEGEKGPVLLVPEVTRNWIIAVAPARTMKRIQQWAAQLDTSTNSVNPFQVYDIQYADVSQVADQIGQAIQASPNLNQTLRVVPFAASRKLLVFGSNRGQRLVKGLLAKLDVENAGDRVTEVIPLEYADAQNVSNNIQTLFSAQVLQSETSWGRKRYGQEEGAARVKVIPNTRRNSVTVMTDATTMQKIKHLIDTQWDLPLDTEDVAPRVYVLKYVDAVQMKDMLTSMFSEQQQSFNFRRFFFGGGNQEQSTPVGRLFGQFSFQALPDSSRLVVTTQNTSNYAVIDKLVKQLDQPQDAGLPTMIELKHANAEDLAEQVNAALAEPGTLAQIVRSRRNLSTGGETSDIAQTLNSSSGGGGGGNNNQNNQQSTNPDNMTFWWQRAQRNPDEQPTSNLIGKLRVVPIVRRNALLILCPRAYRQPIAEMVRKLDKPGAQVIIHAVIAETVHNDHTTLGIRLASNPGILQAARLADQSVLGSSEARFNELTAQPFNLGGNTLARGIISSKINLNVLLQLLIRKYNLRILTEPKLYTGDNEEAEFFDGSDVSVQLASSVTPQGGLNRSFRYVPIGTRLRIRPHITSEGDVKLVINIVLSSISPGASATGNPTFDRRETTTHIIVHNGQTIMLSGIQRQQQLSDVRKIPVLGDLPLLGGLFRSTDKQLQNRELIIFIKPEVVANSVAATHRAMGPYRERLQRMKQRMPGPRAAHPSFNRGQRRPARPRNQ